ncbi:hypothetical protein [Stenotrophomonas maltophilia]|uniref:hypothetical protein n=1 Tax=Stenotrophomonas maltophilia TaxID=40324 RepID=UPI0007397BB9|nr:hypothetical protein [Stenotrophomonas maltophilia]CRD45732.1 conserved hypothetical protein [Stenotrophomonas maltophilia]
MTDINRLCRMAWVPFALLALVACAPGSDPAKTVERDAGTGAVPARPIAGVAQPASLAEGGAAREAVDLRRTDDGGVDIRKVDVAAEQGADASAPPAAAKH